MALGDGIGGGGDDDEWCRLLACVLSPKNLGERFEERLKEAGVNLSGIRRCVAEHCHHHGPTSA